MKVFDKVDSLTRNQKVEAKQHEVEIEGFWRKGGDETVDDATNVKIGNKEN